MAPARRLVVGRRFIVRLSDGDLALTVTGLDSRVDVRRLALGRVRDVTATAEHIEWRASSFQRATVRVHHLRVEPGAPPMLVASPIDVTLDIAADALDDLFRATAPRLTAAVGADGVARVRLARHPHWGHLEVEAGLDGSTLWLSARRVGVGTRRWTLPSGLPRYRIELPETASGLALTAISFSPGVVRVSGTVPQWRTGLLTGLLW